MLTRAEIKSIAELQSSKGRQEQGCFVCEGYRLIKDMLGHFPCQMLVGGVEELQRVTEVLSSLPSRYVPRRVECVDKSFDFHKVSSMKTPPAIVAVFEIPSDNIPSWSKEGKILLLDEVQDPGNVGTLIRTADWFGVKDLYLTAGCADPYAPKVLQSAMGSVAHVSIHRLQSLEAFFSMCKLPVFGAYLEGESIYSISPQGELDSWVLVLGNEGRGISEEAGRYITRPITIPYLGAEINPNSRPDSLNVAVAGAILLNQLSQLGTHPG